MKRGRPPALSGEMRLAAVRMRRNGESITAIAAKIGVSYDTVRRFLKPYNESINIEFDEDRSAVIAQFTDVLNRITAEMFEEYERSKQPEVTVKVVEGGEAVVKGKVVKLESRTETTTRGRNGNPAYLRTALEAVRDVCRMQGLDAPKRIDVTSKGAAIGGKPIEFVEAVRPIDVGGEGTDHAPPE